MKCHFSYSNKRSVESKSLGAKVFLPIGPSKFPCRFNFVFFSLFILKLFLISQVSRKSPHNYNSSPPIVVDLFFILE